MFTKSTPLKPVLYRSKHLRAKDEDDPKVTDRHREIPGFIQEALTNGKVTLIGAGGLGGEIGEAEVRKGVGRLKPGQHLVYASSDLSRLDILALSRNPHVDF